MTQEEKHTIIAEFEGFRQTVCECVRCQERWAAGGKKEMVLTVVPEGWDGPTAAYMDYSNAFANPEFQYSTDLNLCARVEAKIAEMGKGAEYVGWLEVATKAILGDDYDQIFTVVAAPPTARVDAMVQLITTLKP